MKINRFDVVELNNKNRATIREIQNKSYLVEVVDHNGNSLGNATIYDKDINKILYSKSKEFRIL